MVSLGRSQGNAGLDSSRLPISPRGPRPIPATENRFGFDGKTLPAIEVAERVLVQSSSAMGGSQRKNWHCLVSEDDWLTVLASNL